MKRIDLKQIERDGKIYIIDQNGHVVRELEQRMTEKELDAFRTEWSKLRRDFGSSDEN